MEVPLPTCFATLRKGVDGNNADDSHDSMGVVLRWQNGSPNSIQNLEHHVPFFGKASSQATPSQGPGSRPLGLGNCTARQNFRKATMVRNVAQRVRG